MGKQLLHRTLSGWFLVQSYMSAILLFAGIYMAMYYVGLFNSLTFSSYRLNPDSFSGMSISNEASLGVIGIYLAFLYYSTELMTTVGWYSICVWCVVCGTLYVVLCVCVCVCVLP